MMENAAIFSSAEKTTKVGSCDVSVAMATYNGDKYISEQLDSIARQSILPAELVITDDGSSDRTIEIVERFASTAPFPVRLFRNEQRLGYANNFLKATSLCSEKLIAFCDQDDVWLEDKLKTCLGAFEDPEVLLCVHSGELWSGTNRTETYNPRFQARRVFVPLSAYPIQTYPGFAMVIRKKVLEITDNHRRPGFAAGEQMGHDQWVWFLAAIFGEIVVLPDILCLYRQHGNNLFGGTARNVRRTASLAIRPRSYQDISRIEVHFAEFLQQITPQSSASLRPRAEAAARSLIRRAHLNALRAQLYAKESNVFQRLGAFGGILMHGGYLPGRESARIGTRAALKDFVFGVPGIHKRLWGSS